MTNNKFGMLRKTTGAFLSALIILCCGTIISKADDSIFSISNSFNSDYFYKNDTAVSVGKKDYRIPDEVIPGGFPFGVKLYSNGLIIIGFSDIDGAKGSPSPAKDAGMELNDIITKINDKKISDAVEFTETVEKSRGSTLKIAYLRDNNEYECEVTPSYSDADGKYKVGLWLRDSTAGIGTVTFVVPETGIFAGLGHGICDSETGALIPLSKGIISDVKIEGIKKGVSGTPGELRGSFNGTISGDMLSNTNNGIFGIFSKSKKFDCEKIRLGTRNDVCDGDAHIICTLDGNKTDKYSVKLSQIHKDSTGNKNFIITITDQKLIEKTGGIVQGMSGSPIIQNGKLVGAVTHVLVGDPTKGYGIFIDNMIDGVVNR